MANLKVQVKSIKINAPFTITMQGDQQHMLPCQSGTCLSSLTIYDKVSICAPSCEHSVD